MRGTLVWSRIAVPGQVPVYLEPVFDLHFGSLWRPVRPTPLHSTIMLVGLLGLRDQNVVLFIFTNLPRVLLHFPRYWFT